MTTFHSCHIIMWQCYGWRRLTGALLMEKHRDGIKIGGFEKFSTAITELLDAHGVSYRLLPHDEPVFTVAAAARQRGVVQEEMVKSLLLRDKDRRYVLACVTGDARLDTQALRAQLPAEWGGCALPGQKRSRP